jgi:hypothetical protein
LEIFSSKKIKYTNQAIQNQRNSFLRGFPLPFNVETLQAIGALFQIPHYYRKFLHCKAKMLCNYVINTIMCKFISIPWKTILNAIFIRRSHIIFFLNLQKVLLLRLGLFSILYLIFFEEKISNNAILFIYFRGYY